jgi:two-component system OmpR family response regulator
MLILVVDDDEDYAEIIAQALRRDSHDVVTVGDGAGAVKFAEAKSPDLAILDVMLPDTSGLQLCRRIRQRLPTMPVIFLSSLDRTDDVVAGLESGGDDYITKPFHPSELVARVRAVVRRPGRGVPEAGAAPRRIAALGLELDPVNSSASLNGINLLCTKLEFEILRELAEYPGQVLSHAFLTERVWGYKNVDDATLLKARISAIRRKIRDAGGNEDMIRTVHGVGYSLIPV